MQSRGEAKGKAAHRTPCCSEFMRWLMYTSYCMGPAGPSGGGLAACVITSTWAPTMKLSDSSQVQQSVRSLTPQDEKDPTPIGIN